MLMKSAFIIMISLIRVNALPPMPIAMPQPSDSDGFEGLVTQLDDGKNNLSLLVGGVHCALCIQKIESAIKSYPDVDYVRLNFSTGRLVIHWHGTTAQANIFVSDIQSLGYRVDPYNPEREKKNNDQENRFCCYVWAWQALRLAILCCCPLVCGRRMLQQWGRQRAHYFIGFLR